MTIKDIIAKTVTDIYVSLKMDVGSLDTGECFIQLNDDEFINIPFGQDSEILEVKKPPTDAASIFKDLSDIPVHHINRRGKTIDEVADNF